MATQTLEANITIKPPNFRTAEFRIVGTAPYVSNKFSQKAQIEIEEKQKQGSTAKKGTRQAKDFEALYEGSKHVAADGWAGMPASAFRNAMISACKVVGFHMTKAKLCVFVEPDGFDKDDGTPLVKITKGEPWHHRGPVRLETGVVDIRSRAMWNPGWEAEIRITFDADQFTLSDVSNLLMRVGIQVGIGEGRPDSKKSAGMGWGTFRVKDSD